MKAKGFVAEEAHQLSIHEEKKKKKGEDGEVNVISRMILNAEQFGLPRVPAHWSPPLLGFASGTAA